MVTVTRFLSTRKTRKNVTVLGHSLCNPVTGEKKNVVSLHIFGFNYAVAITGCFVFSTVKSSSPFRFAGIPDDNTLVLKISQLPSKPRFLVQSFSLGHYPPIYQPSEGVYSKLALLS